MSEREPVASFEKATPVCRSAFMHETLCNLSQEQVQGWRDKMSAIDAVISGDIEANWQEIQANQGKVTKEIADRLREKLASAGIETDYDLENIEFFQGYTFYTNPDNGALSRLMNNPEMYYGVARTTSVGKPHVHHESDAFNLVLSGEGVFTGNPEDEGKFPNYYHGLKLEKGVEIEIPIGMTHGHLVKHGSDLWFFALQQCGFGKGKKCEGDFHSAENYDLTQFGPEYQ